MLLLVLSVAGLGGGGGRGRQGFGIECSEENRKMSAD